MGLERLPFSWIESPPLLWVGNCETMPGLKKLKKKRKFNYGRNISRVRKQQEKTNKFNVAVNVDCKTMKDVWNSRVSLKENLEAMGVAVDANTVLPKISAKKKMLKDLKKRAGKEEMEEVEEKGKTEVIQKLEEEAAYIPVQSFRFTPSQVQLITYMMDKHGEDWGAMARDPRNHYQETPAKLRGMVSKFVSIPEHYVVYCKDRGLIEPSVKPMEEETDEDEGEEVEEEEDNYDDEELENSD